LQDAFLTAQIKMLLIDSLFAENSARFIAMDMATQNADQLIDQLKIVYNKLRQALITKELIELSFSATETE